MSLLDKDSEKRVVLFLKEVNLKLFLQHTDETVARILKTVEKMPAMEKKIITRKYLSTEADYTWHYEIYQDMCISDVLYKKLRIRGLQKIAAEFGLISDRAAVVGCNI
ncbi:hypothetical protein D3C87_935650 [compost metagenome]